MVTRDRPLPRFNDETATIARSSDGPRPAPIGAVIRVADAPATPEAIRLTAGTCVVGSGSHCDIAIADPTVSRTHLELGLVPEGVSLKDLGSRNGTFYQGQRVEKMTLALGARIMVGKTTLTIDADAEALAQGSDYAGTFYRGMVGVSLPMRRLFGMLTRLEGSLATVLVQGESGVGKELVARALHEGSSVANGPFIAVNCGAIPRELVASELFGHRRGAFSGAVDARKGAFECADGGTLFLDEIGELPMEVQPVLLRSLELGEVRALGEDHTKRVKVRFVAATNRNLEAEVRAGKFRQDLFYRLAVVRLAVPALRERPEDIEPLARRFAATLGMPNFSPVVIDQLKSRAWPGNARELLNAIQAYAALGSVPEAPRIGGELLDQGFSEMVDVRRPYADQKEEVTDRFTRVYLQALMAHCAGNQSQASRLAGLNRSYLGRLLAKHGLAKPRPEGEAEGDEG
jgi:DNA-binding NtrC family response regulator